MSLALFSGLLLALSFPNILQHEIFWGSNLLAWFSLIPLLISLEAASPKAAFQRGLAAGLLTFLLGTYWINFIRPMGPGALPAWLGLSAYLALYPAAFAWTLALGRRRGLPFQSLWIPALWTLLEYARELLLTGYPWMSLGSSQSLNRVLLPLASVTGIYGLHYAVALGNTLLWQARVRTWPKREWLAAALSVALIVGLRLMASPRPKAASTVKVAVIQGNFNQDQDWTEDYRHALMTTYGSLMQEALRSGAKVMIWPESSFPAIFSSSVPEARALIAFARNNKVSLLVGATLKDTSGSYGNAAVFIDAAGNTDAYLKRHLVPFGEFIPFRKWIPLLDHLLEQMGMPSFKEGGEAKIFQDGAFKTSPLICYESVYSSMARESKTGCISLVTLDTWFGNSPAPYHHLSQSVFRAVEGGRWVARAAATGVSAFIAPDGRIVQSQPLNTAGMLVQDLDCEISPTLYMRFGAWFVWLCMGFLVLSCVFMRKTANY